MIDEEFNEEFDADTKFRLTKQAIMQLVLQDFGIDVNITIAKHILEELFEKLEKHGYVEWHEGEDNDE